MLKLIESLFFILLTCILNFCWCARILAVFPAPFLSHQLVFRPLTQELVKRGHDVVVITTDPAFEENVVSKLTEINIHNVSYKLRDNLSTQATGRIGDLCDQVDKFYDMFGELVEAQFKTVEVQNLISNKDQYFDILLIEALVRPALVFSYIFKAPVITISTVGSVDIFTEYLGVPSHPILYPNSLHQRLKNMTHWEKATEIYKHYLFRGMIKSKEANENAILNKIFGNDVPPLRELYKNVAMLMINVHHLWEDNRPVPPNVIYLGGLHLELNDTKKLSLDLKSFLDSSTHGVIYMSLGSLVVPSRLVNMDIVLSALSKLPYDVLLKWDKDFLSGCPSNVKIINWSPQREVLRHPNVKLFITQGGLQSTDEAIVSGVPLIGIPVIGDQWYNVEKYVELKIGLRTDLEDVTVEKMLNTISKVINDNSYTRNIHALREKLYDKPESSLQRAVWWIEYILRHGKSSHLQSASAHLSAWEFYELDLILVVLSIFTILLCVLIVVVYKLYKWNSNFIKVKIN